MEQADTSPRKQTTAPGNFAKKLNGIKKRGDAALKKKKNAEVSGKKAVGVKAAKKRASAPTAKTKATTDFPIEPVAQVQESLETSATG